MKLTHANYRSPSNHRISNSKISAYLSSPAYFKALYLDKTEEFKQTQSMLIGSMVDHAFNEDRVDAIKERWEVKLKQTVKKKENKELFEKQKELIAKQKATEDQSRLVTPGEMQTACEIAETLLRQPFMEFYRQKEKGKKVMKQSILIGNVRTPGGKVAICGIPDVYTLITKPDCYELYIDDLKTCEPTALKTKYHWYRHCKDYGYFRQLLMYRLMLEEFLAPRVARTKKDLKVFTRHFVISNQKKRGKYEVKLFIIGSEVLDYQNDELITVLDEMVADTTYEAPSVGWKDVEYLTEVPEWDK